MAKKQGKYRIRETWKRITAITAYALIGDKNLEYVFVHHTVTALPAEYFAALAMVRGNGVTAKSRKQAKKTVRRLERQHMRTLEKIALNRGFAGISYTLVHFPSGHVYKGRGFRRVGAHTLGYNEKGYGLVAVGNYDNDIPTADLLNALVGSIKKGKRSNRIAEKATVQGHRDVGQTACPGSNLCAALPYVRKRAA